MRTALLSLALGLFVSSCASMNPGAAEPNQMQCSASETSVNALRKAFVFALPLYEMRRTRQRMLSFPGAKPNSLIHRTQLSKPGNRSITMPNTDTLYSTAWLDLSGGPVRFSIPAMGERYNSVQLMDAFSDVFAILRNQGERERSVLIVGPDWKGDVEFSERVIRAPTRDAWLVGRIFVAGPDDLASAQILQQGYQMNAIGGPAFDEVTSAPIPDRPTARQFLAVVNAALSRGLVPEVHRERLACFKDAGIGRATGHGDNDLDPGMRSAWDANIDRFYAETQEAFGNAGILRGGWRYPKSNIGVFGTDDEYRATIALAGLAALPLTEAKNLVATRDADGEVLNGSSSFQLRIPGHVPIDGFWSVTLYQSDGEGHWYFYENLIDRFAIRSTTAGLSKQTDGGIVLAISHNRPADDANWLPAPDGPFLLVFRAYRPQSAFLDGSFELPSVERAAQ